MATDNERKTVVAAIKRPETTSSTAEIRRLGKKLLVAALLGRWEELFLHVTKLIRMTLSTVYRVGQSKKERLSRWLFSPLVAEGALPMAWTRSDLPMGPLGRSALFLLRRIKRWQIWLGMTPISTHVHMYASSCLSLTLSLSILHGSQVCSLHRGFSSARPGRRR